MPSAPVAKVTVDPLDVAGPTTLRAMTTAVESLLRATPSAVSAAAVGSAIRSGALRRSLSVDRAVLARHAAPLAAALSRAAEAAAREELRRHPQKAAKNTLDFDLVEPAVVKYAEKRAAELVVEIDKTTRESLRALVRMAVNAEPGRASWRSLAASVREKIGLHSRWSRAVMNYQLRLEAGGSAPEKVSQLVSRYYAKLLTARARNISRTEIMRAANAGKVESWRTMRDEGWTGNAKLVKVWEAAADAEEICAAADGQEVPLDDLFSTSEGSFDMPPAHPSCRCTAVMVAVPR